MQSRDTMTIWRFRDVLVTRPDDVVLIRTYKNGIKNLKRKERESCSKCGERNRPCDGLFPDCEYYRRAPGTTASGPHSHRTQSELELLEQQIQQLERKLQNLTKKETAGVVFTAEVNWNVADPKDEIGIPPPFNRRPVEMKERWWDRPVLSPPVRNYLINIAISASGQYFSYFHSPTLFQSLELRDPRQQPHPALLEALYLTACFATSFLPSNSPYCISKHETHFLLRARKAMEDSLAHCDRLLDYLKASNLVTSYLLMTGRYLEAFHQHAGASRLALSCGLHRIGSPVYGANPVTVERSGPQLIPPPTNQLELGDRILTFWSIYSRDKASSIITGFASAIDDVHDDIITPLPRPPSEYETNNVRPVDVERLSDIFSPSASRAAERRPDTIFSSQLKGLTLLGRARAASPSPQTEQWERINKATQRFLNGMFQTHPSLDSNSATQEPLSVGLATAVAAGYTAAIFLNADLSLTEPDVQQDRVRWAKTMATMMVGLPLEEAIKACAVFGYLLGKAAEVLILHKKVAVARGLHDADVELVEVDECISRILEAIKSLTATYPALTFQVYHVQRLVDAALRAEVKI